MGQSANSNGRSAAGLGANGHESAIAPSPDPIAESEFTVPDYSDIEDEELIQEEQAALANLPGPECLDHGEVARQSKPAMSYEDALKLIRMDQRQSEAAQRQAEESDIRFDDRLDLAEVAYELMFPILYTSADDRDSLDPSLFLIPRFVEPFPGAGAETMMKPYIGLALSAPPRHGAMARHENESKPSHNGEKEIRFIDAKQDECSITVDEKNEKAFYEKGGRLFWIQSQRSAWIPVDLTSMKRHLKARRFFHFSHPVALSPQEKELNRIQTDCAVDYVGGVAGYRKGLRRICEHEVLVTSEAMLLAPIKGEFPILDRFLKNLLDESDVTVDQRDYLYCWLKTSLTSLYAGEPSLGPALILVGPPHQGKSYLQKLVTDMLGGRSANPYQYMTGQTPFNSELFQAEHLAIEDQVAPSKLSDKNFFAQKFKEFCVNERRSCHRKGREQITLTSYCRLTMSLNDEEHCLKTLPDLLNDVRDKLMILRAGHKKLPVRPDGVSIAEFHNAVRKELPRFMDWLMHTYQIPAELYHGRFGFKMYHHPEVEKAMLNMRPEAKLLQLIDRELFRLSKDGTPIRRAWTGRANELEHALMDPGTTTSNEARALFKERETCGQLLLAIEKAFPHRVRSWKKDKYNVWQILPETHSAEASAGATGTGEAKEPAPNSGF